MMNKIYIYWQKYSPFFLGALVAIMGGLIGLGGAEFRLPILLKIFNYPTLKAIIINLVVSLVTVIFSLIFRSGLAGVNNILANSTIIINILAGSLIGAYLGVNYASRINERVLNKIVVIFLVIISLILMAHEFIFSLEILQLPSLLKIITALLAGIVIGIFSSLLGVAGGELIIPTIILIFAVDIKIAGSLSLVISIPTIIMGLWKYNRQGKLQQIEADKSFLILMATGSIFGAFIGSYIVQYIASSLLYWILGIILLISAFKLAKH